jgi:hypothetical protein
LLFENSSPYPTLASFVVPVLVLEPAKPVAAYLTATGLIAKYAARGYFLEIKMSRKLQGVSWQER